MRHGVLVLEAPGRVELPTNGLGNRCSIHLSYGADCKRCPIIPCQLTLVGVLADSVFSVATVFRSSEPLEWQAFRDIDATMRSSADTGLCVAGV